MNVATEFGNISVYTSAAAARRNAEHEMHEPALVRFKMMGDQELFATFPKGYPLPREIKAAGGEIIQRLTMQASGYRWR